MIQIDTKTLKELVSKVEKAVASRTTLPILECIKIEVNDSKLSLAATNLEIGMEAYTDCNGSIDPICVPGKRLFDIINALPDSEVELETKTKTMQLVIKSGKHRNAINGIDAKDFPLIEFDKTNITMNGKEFCGLLDKVIFSAATDESRQILCGCLVAVKDGKIKFAASDGFRISEVISDAGISDVSLDIKCIVPAKSLKEIRKIVGENVELFLSDRRFTAKSGNVSCVSQLIDGNFPDYAPIFPKDHAVSFAVDASTLNKRLKVVEVIAREKANISTWEVGNGMLQLSANAAEVGDSDNETDVEVEGEYLEQFALNTLYVQHVLGVINGNVVVKVKSKMSPIYFLEQGNDNFKHVIMPMQLGDRQNG